MGVAKGALATIPAIGAGTAAAMAIVAFKLCSVLCWVTQ
jgi:hypothetical protein